MYRIQGEWGPYSVMWLLGNILRDWLSTSGFSGNMGENSILKRKASRALKRESEENSHIATMNTTFILFWMSQALCYLSIWRTLKNISSNSSSYFPNEPTLLEHRAKNTSVLCQIRHFQSVINQVGYHLHKGIACVSNQEIPVTISFPGAMYCWGWFFDSTAKTGDAARHYKTKDSTAGPAELHRETEGRTLESRTLVFPDLTPGLLSFKVRNGRSGL